MIADPGECKVLVPPYKDLGEAMRALTPKRRAFVIAWGESGFAKGKATAAAQAAGCKGNKDSIRVTASRMARDQKVLRAIAEESAKMEGQMGWRAQARLAELVESLDEDVALKASTKVLEMTGRMTQRVEHKHVHEIAALPTEELNRRIAELENRVLAEREAERARLAPPQIVDAEFAVVESAGAGDDSRCASLRVAEG